MDDKFYENFDSAGRLVHPGTVNHRTWEDITIKEAAWFLRNWDEKTLSIGKLLGVPLATFNGVERNEWGTYQTLLKAASGHMNAMGLAVLFLALGGYPPEDQDWLLDLDPNLETEVAKILGMKLYQDFTPEPATTPEGYSQYFTDEAE